MYWQTQTLGAAWIQTKQFTHNTYLWSGIAKYHISHDFSPSWQGAIADVFAIAFTIYATMTILERIKPWISSKLVPLLKKAAKRFISWLTKRY